MTQPKLISSDYQQLNREMHKRDFGGGGYKRVPYILPLIKDEKIKTVLDYGCGQGTFGQHLKTECPEVVVTNYDPARKEWDKRPEGLFDLVVCTDVLEHIEPEYIDNVISDLLCYTGRYCFLLIACVEANKVLPDGRNAHLIQEQPNWWFNKLQRQDWQIIKTDPQINKDNTAVFKKVFVTLAKRSQMQCMS